MPETRTVSTLIHGRWIRTMDPTQPFLEQHCIAIDDGNIVGIIPSDDPRFSSEQEIHLNHHVLMPGLINAHGHTPMTLFRGLADDISLMDWLNHHIWPAEQQWVDEAFTLEGATLAMAEMIRSGTTCFSDMYFYPEVVSRAAANAHMRCQIAFPILDFPTNWAQDANEYLEKGLALHAEYQQHHLVTVALGPHAPYTVSDAPFNAIALAAQQHDMSIQIHLHETANEVAEALESTGKRPLQRLHELGLLGPHLQAVHMTQLTDEEITLLTETGTHVIHCPESNLKLASGFCPVAKLMDAGVNVALGTDGAASNNDLDLLGELRTAALLAKGIAGDPSVVPAHKALEMATLNGAKALGIDHITGSLTVGKAADIIAIDLNDVCCQPHYHIDSQLVYATPSSQVTDSWIGGKQVMKQRQLTTLDLTAALNQAANWKTRIQKADEAHP